MKRIIKILLILISAITLGSLITPFFLCQKLTDALEMAANLMSATAGIAAIVIAFLFYEKFGVSRKMIERQSETVFELLEALKATRILGEHNNGFIQLFIQNDLSSYKTNWMGEVNNKKVTIRPMDYAAGMESVSKFAESIWIPNEIKKKIYPLMFIHGKHIKDFSVIEKDYIRIYFSLSNNELEKEEAWCEMNLGEMTFGDFLKSIEELIDVTKKWIEKHSDFEVPLNI